MARYGLNLRSEAHAEHSISLVENEELHVGEIEGAVLDKMLQTSRSGDKNVAAFPELAQLVTDNSSTVDNDRLEDGIVGEFAGFVVDLNGQLSSGGYDHNFGVLNRVW